MLGEGLILGKPQSQGQCGVRARRAGRAAVGADSLSPAPVCGQPALGWVLLPREAPALVAKPQGYACASPLSGVGWERTEAGLQSWLCGPPVTSDLQPWCSRPLTTVGLPRLYGEEHATWTPLMECCVWLLSFWHLASVCSRLPRAVASWGYSVAVHALLVAVAPLVVGRGLNSCGV